jgi:sugar phosphate isomerase/epimerase
MWPSIGICWGTVRQSSLLELIDVAAAHGFPTITVPPHIIDLCMTSGVTVAHVRRRLADGGVKVTVIDALTRDLPGAPPIDEIPAIWRENWKYSLDDLIPMAEALEAPTINVTHYLGKPVQTPDMAQAVAGLAERAGRCGLNLALEFIPETSLANLPDTAKIVQLCGAGNVGIMLDIWHLLRSGGLAADIRALPPRSLTGVQLNDRRANATPASLGTVGDRSMPGEGDAPLAEIVQAILDNTPSVDIEIEVFSEELAALSPVSAGERVARSLAAWQSSLDLKRAPKLA